jgi:hypothetical protein
LEGITPRPGFVSRQLKNAHLRRCPHPSSLRRTVKYASLLRISGASHLSIFEQPDENDSFSNLLGSTLSGFLIDPEGCLHAE